MIPSLIIRSSSIHAAGCCTTRPIRKNTRIVEYGGRRITKQQADELYSDRIVTYLFGVDGTNLVIDGYGTAMYINHSCAPNCATEEVNSRIFIRAIRDIAAGEELLYEYNLYDSDSDDYDCYCGSANCRGTMLSEDEVKRQARVNARKAARKKQSQT